VFVLLIDDFVTSDSAGMIFESKLALHIAFGAQVARVRAAAQH